MQLVQAAKGNDTTALVQLLEAGADVNWQDEVSLSLVLSRALSLSLVLSRALSLAVSLACCLPLSCSLSRSLALSRTRARATFQEYKHRQAHKSIHMFLTCLTIQQHARMHIPPAFLSCARM